MQFKLRKGTDMTAGKALTVAELDQHGSPSPDAYTAGLSQPLARELMDPRMFDWLDDLMQQEPVRDFQGLDNGSSGS